MPERGIKPFANKDNVSNLSHQIDRFVWTYNRSLRGYLSRGDRIATPNSQSDLLAKTPIINGKRVALKIREMSGQ